MNPDEIGRLLVAEATMGRAQQEAEIEIGRERREAELERQRLEDEARRRHDTGVQKHRRIDTRILRICAFLVLSFVIPGLIGYFVLRGTFILPTHSSGDSESRNWMPYLWWTTFATQGVVLIVAGAGLLRPPYWRERVPFVVVGAILVVVGFIVVPQARSHFQYQELWGTAFPYDDNFMMCGEPVVIPVSETSSGDSEASVWQMYRARTTDSTTEECNLIELYRGSSEVADYKLPPGEFFLPRTAPDGGAAMYATNGTTPIPNSDLIEAPLSEITFFARTNTGRVLSVNLAEPTVWR